MIDTVVFDVGNVLTCFGWKDFIKSFGYSEDVTERIGKATIEGRYWNEYDRGVMTNDEIVNNFVSLDKGIENEIRTTMKCFTGILKPAEYAIPWIGELKNRGLRVLFLSNFSERAFNECQDALGFLDYVDGGIFSYRVGLIKPDPAIYRKLIETYALTPQNCVFIDDLKDNVAAASAIGFNTILFEEYNQARAELKQLLIMH